MICGGKCSKLGHNLYPEFGERNGFYITDLVYELRDITHDVVKRPECECEGVN